MRPTGRLYKTVSAVCDGIRSFVDGTNALGVMGRAGATIPLLLATLGGISLSAQEIQLQRVWEVGAVDGPPEAIWSRIEDATIMAGHVYAVDIDLQMVRRFELSGEYRGELGGVGQGPGEFARPISVSARSDTVTVLDFAQRRWALFDSQGQHLRTSRLPSESDGYYFDRLWTARHGWYIGQTLTEGASNPSAVVTQLHTLVWRPPEVFDTLLAIESNSLWYRDEPDEQFRIFTSFNLGPDGGSWLLGDSLLVTLDANEGRAHLWRLTSSGIEEVRSRELSGERREVTSADRETVTASFRWLQDLSTERRLAYEFVFPDSWSAWTAVLGDEEGNLWIRRGGPRNVDRTVGEQWVRWSLRDDAMTEVELPAGVEALRFREGHLVGKREDEWGVEYLVLYRLMGR